MRADQLAAFAAAQQAQDADALAQAALALAEGHRFGTHPGRVPAFLHEAYRLAQGTARIRLAVALARIWAYAYDPDQAAPFAAEAEAAADRLADPTLLAEALDARLLVSWGPDQFAERLRITARLDETVAHVGDVEARLSAHLWRLTTALESLDAVTVRRQLRALDRLAVESGAPRVHFYAAARSGMLALVHGDLDGARRCRDEAQQAGAEAGEADTEAIVRTLTAGIARQEGDRATLAAEAAAFEGFGMAEGVVSVAAEGALLWLDSGADARAAGLLQQLAGPDFSTVPCDVDWLLTLTTLTEVAARTGNRPLAEAGVTRLEPYAGRGVVNGGAVAFAGVVDDCLRSACASLGRAGDANRWATSAAEGYRRLGAVWWLQRLGPPAAPPPTGPLTARLVREAGGLWSAGLNGSTVAMRDMKGLHYLHLLLHRPGEDVPALDLSAQVAGHGGVAEAGLGELVDRPALAAYRRRLADLDAELDEARAWSDEGRRARAQDERDALVEHLAAAAGLHGRQRLAGGSAERARVAVRKAIVAALDRIAEQDPALGRLLRDTVRTGATCRYEPDPGRPVQWTLDARRAAT